MDFKWINGCFFVVRVLLLDFYTLLNPLKPD